MEVFMNKIYNHKGYLVIPNWVSNDEEYFHIVLDDEIILDRIDSLYDAEIWIEKHIKESELARRSTNG